jgi:hypothetical protein
MLYGIIWPAPIGPNCLGYSRSWMGSFLSGVIDGFEKAIDIGTPIIKNLTHEARGYVNNMEQLTS